MWVVSASSRHHSNKKNKKSNMYSKSEDTSCDIYIPRSIDEIMERKGLTPTEMLAVILPLDELKWDHSQKKLVPKRRYKSVAQLYEEDIEEERWREVRRVAKDLAKEYGIQTSGPHEPSEWVKNEMKILDELLQRERAELMKKYPDLPIE